MLGLQAEQRFRNAYVIIEITLGVKHVVFLRKHCGNEFLGCGLTIGTRDANDRNLELASVFTCQVLEGLQAVVNEDETVVLLVFGFVDNGVGATFLQRHSRKLIAVEGSSFEGNENTSGRTITAVGGDNRMLLIQLIKFFDIHFRESYYGAKIQLIFIKKVKRTLFSIILYTFAEYERLHTELQGTISQPQ